MDIYTIKSILNDIVSKNNPLSNSANKSLNNLYKNISNPVDEFKNNI
jgi:hypothetical protein